MKPLTAICTAWFLVAGSAMLGAQTTAQAEKLLESARHKEVMEGDLKAAIEQYRKIAAQFAKQPEIAAKALLQMGQCQEKLGQAEARKSYERIVREYASAQEYVSAARARLAALGGGGVAGRDQLRNRLLLDRAPVEVWHASSDGRWISYPDTKTGDLAIRDLVSGEERRLTNRGVPEKNVATGSVVSYDGKTDCVPLGRAA